MPQCDANRGLTPPARLAASDRRSELVMPQCDANRGLTPPARLAASERRSGLVMPQCDANRGLTPPARLPASGRKLAFMAPIFQPNSDGLARLDDALAIASDAALDKAGGALRAWGEEFRRRLAAASPVGLGGLASSWQVIVEETERGISVAVGTHLRGKDGAPYPLYLELGTARIAGGRVVAWEPGEAPVVDWPAKSHAERKQAPVVSDLAQMPLVRPIGYEIARRVIEELRTIMGDAFDERLDGARF